MPIICSSCGKRNCISYVKGDGSFLCPKCELESRKEEKWLEKKGGGQPTKKSL